MSKMLIAPMTHNMVILVIFPLEWASLDEHLALGD